MREESERNFAHEVPASAVRIHRMTIPHARRDSNRPSPDPNDLDLQVGFGGRPLAIAPAYDPVARIF